MGLGWLCCFVEKSDCIGWLDCVLAGWIVSLYRCIDGYLWIWIVSAGLAGLDHNGWMRTHSFCKYGVDVTDGRMEWM